MKIFTVLALLLSSTLATSGGDLKTFISATDIFLREYVSKGSVAYSKISKSEIEPLYREIGAMDVKSLDSNSKKAFYINAYNLAVIYSIVQSYPVKSPMDIDGFFDKKIHFIAGEQLTLNGLEKEKLLAVYKDARLHFVLVCAAKSCPPLMSGAFTPDQVEAQLGQRTKLTVNDNAWLNIFASQKKAEVSKIFEWYNGDFTSSGKSLLDWINIYRNSKIPSNYKVEFYEYDWALNE